MSAAEHLQHMSFLYIFLWSKNQGGDISPPSFSHGGLARPSRREKAKYSLGRFEYQYGQIGWEGAGRREEGRLRRASGRTVGEMEREGERDLSFAPRSTCSPVMHPAGGGKHPDV